MKAENQTKLVFPSLSVNEAYARGAVAAFLCFLIRLGLLLHQCFVFNHFILIS